jgi:hypothetical protein
MSSSSQEYNFMTLHEAARHAIHSEETLRVSIETMNAISEEKLSLTQQFLCKTGQNCHSAIQAHMKGQILQMKNFLERACSNKKRIDIEISLVWTQSRVIPVALTLKGNNMIAQKDSQVLLSLSKESKADSSAMKVLAVVATLFLPPTLIAVSI